MWMREKMARALCRWSHGGEEDNGWPRYLPAVDAQLDALLDPTPEMVAAAVAACDAMEKSNIRALAAVKGATTGWFSMLRAAKDGK